MDLANLSINPIETPPEPKAKKHRGLGLAIGGAVLLLVIASFFVIIRNQNSFNQEQTEPNDSPEIIINSEEPDLSEVSNLEIFSLSRSDKEALVENQFMVRPATFEEFFPLYRSNKTNNIPSFITTDSILHSYHLLFDSLLKQLEERELATGLQSLNQQMLNSSLAQYEALQGTAWEAEAKRNIAFFTVGGRLLEPQFPILEIVATEVNQELELIDRHQGVEISPVMTGQSKESVKEDYSQYLPRGHYTRSEKLENYFRAMMWYGRSAFRISNVSELKSALLITLALNKEPNLDQWKKLYEPINFFIDKSDDLAHEQIMEIITQIYGTDLDIFEISQDQDSFNQFVAAVGQLAKSKISPISAFSAVDQEEKTKDFRFMGQRLTIDTEIFQHLISGEVGPKGLPCHPPFGVGRQLPQGLDIPAALGSTEALTILEELGETEHACYLENLGELKTYLQGFSEKDWRQSLYWSWLHQLRPLLETKRDNQPLFMQNSAWTRKSLNTFLGSWAELKHDTILYTIQAETPLMSAGPPSQEEPEPVDDRGYVEPNPEVYDRLSILADKTLTGLGSRDLLNTSQKNNLLQIKQLANSLRVISEKELAEESLSEEEYELIRSYGDQLSSIWYEANRYEPAFINSSGDYLEENPAAVITDVATDPNGAVLEAGIGNIFNIFVIVPIEGQLRLARGGVFSYYEFPWPMNDRLTDEKWRAMIRPDSNVPLPKLPQWTSAYLVSSQE